MTTVVQRVPEHTTAPCVPSFKNTINSSLQAHQYVSEHIFRIPEASPLLLHFHKSAQAHIYIGLESSRRTRSRSSHCSIPKPLAEDTLRAITLLLVAHYCRQDSRVSTSYTIELCNPLQRQIGVHMLGIAVPPGCWQRQRVSETQN